MIRFSTLIVCLLIAAMASATEKTPEFEDAIRHSPAGLSRQPDVQRELGVTEKQVADLAKALQPIEEAYVLKVKAAARLKPDEAETALAAALAQASSDASEAVLGLLTPAQAKRLNQIDIQQRVPESYRDEPIRKALGITEVQTTKLIGLKLEYDLKVRRFKREASGATGPKTIPDTELQLAGQELLAGKTYPMLKKEYALVAKNILTNDQLNLWYDSIGEPFPRPLVPKK